MNLYLYIILLFSASMIAGCAVTRSAPAKIYTNQEYTMMTYCLGITDVANNAATEKLKGTPKEKVQEFYVAKPQSVLNIATVDKVYNDRLTSVWDYSVNFFTECSNNLAKVTTSRINMASYCMQNQLMAEITHSYKSSGSPKENAYGYFEKFNSKTSHVIIDKVYASAMTRAEAKMDAWNSCMTVVSDIKS